MTTAIIVIVAYGLGSLALGMVVGRHLARRSREDAARGYVDVSKITADPEWAWPPRTDGFPRGDQRLSYLDEHSLQVDSLRRRHAE